jgi:hypothetical protein
MRPFRRTWRRPKRLSKYDTAAGIPASASQLVFQTPEAEQVSSKIIQALGQSTRTIRHLGVTMFKF